MKTKLTSRQELKEIFIEVLLSTSDKVTKVSNHSVLNGVGFGVAAIGQKAMKDILLAETLINPDIAYGPYLDRLAANWGISPRFGTIGSSTYIYVTGLVGTVYPSGSNITGTLGIIFETTINVTLGSEGYAYIPVRSLSSGSNTNVPPLSLTEIDPIPTDHIYLINEYMAIGGLDNESDEHFRQRIKEGANGIASATLSKLEQVMMRENSIVLKLFHGGVASNGSNILKVATVNGSELSPTELENLLSASANYLPLSDFRNYQGIESYGVILENILYEEIDVSFQVKIYANYEIDEVRKKMQVNLSKYFDYRFFNNVGIIEWDDLFQIVKNTEGVEYIADQTFIPGADFNIPKNSLPRIRGFLMYDLEGNLISDDGGNLDPIYYPNSPDRNTQVTI